MGAVAVVAVVLRPCCTVTTSCHSVVEVVEEALEVLVEVVLQRQDICTAWAVAFSPTVNLTTTVTSRRITPVARYRAAMMDPRRSFR